MSNIKELRKKHHKIKVRIQIGKNKLTNQQIDEIKKELKARKIVKIKFLPSAGKRETLNQLIAEIINIIKPTAHHYIGRVLTINLK